MVSGFGFIKLRNNVQRVGAGFRLKSAVGVHQRIGLATERCSPRHKSRVRTAQDKSGTFVHVNDRSQWSPLHNLSSQSLLVSSCAPGVRCTTGGKAGLSIRKHDQFTPARKMRRDVRALTVRSHPEGCVYLEDETTRPLGPAT
jgi:hypothetical protein